MLIAAALGALVGIIMALSGAGGGILAVPLLVFGLHLNMAQAGPIGLMAVGLAALLGAILGLVDGIVRYKAALLIASAGALCSPLGLWLAQRLPNRPLSVLFALVLLWVAYRSWHQAKAGHTVSHPHHIPCQINPATGRFIWNLESASVFVGVGAVAGLLSGLLGVGGGFVLVPVLRRYSGLSMKSIVATSLAVIALVSLVGVGASSWSGHLDWALGLPFSVGAIGGMLLARLFGHHMAAHHLSRGFAIAAGLAALLLLWKVMV